MDKMPISIFFDNVQVRTAKYTSLQTEHIVVILFHVKKYVKSVVLGQTAFFFFFFFSPCMLYKVHKTFLFFLFQLIVFPTFICWSTVCPSKEKRYFNVAQTFSMLLQPCDTF